MKKILIPTDFSDNATNAALYGLSLFGKEECDVILLNTFNIPYTGHDVIVTNNDKVQDDSKVHFDKLINKINGELEGNNFRITAEFHVGNLETVINGIVEDKQIDQVIMGTQGASGLKKVLIGSSTASVVGSVSTNLLAVPENSVYSIPNKIVLAINDYNDLNEEILAPLVSLAQHFDAEIMLYHVTDILDDKVPENLDVIYKYFSKVKHSVHSAFSDDAAFAIEEFAINESANLLAVLRYQKGFFAKLFHKSLTKQMIYHAKLPMLVLNN